MKCIGNNISLTLSQAQLLIDLIENCKYVGRVNAVFGNVTAAQEIRSLEDVQEKLQLLFEGE